MTAISEDAFRASKVNSIIIPETVKSIGDWAFYECNDLTILVLPNSIEKAGEGAFGCCQKLTNVDIPVNLTVLEKWLFSDCGLINVIIPDNIIDIKDLVFQQNTSLKSVTFGKSVENIGSGVFSYCPNIATFICKNETPPVCPYNFINVNAYDNITLYVPESSLELYSSTYPWSEFTFIKKLSELDMPAEEGDIFETDGLFYRILSTTDLTVEVTYDPSTNGNKYSGDIAIPSVVKYLDENYSVISIGKNAFSQCYDLSNVEIPESIIRIEEEAFAQCHSLNEINLPKNLTSIGRYAFYNSAIQSLVVPAGIISIEEGTFSECVFLENLEFLGNVISIGDNAFWAFGINTLVLPESVETIGSYAFADAFNLESVYLPNSLIELSENSFSNCDKLSVIYLGENMLKIGERAFFSRSDSIKQIISKNSVPPGCGEDVFNIEIYQKATLYVPESSLELYASTYPWSEFINILPIHDENEPEIYQLPMKADPTPGTYTQIIDSVSIIWEEGISLEFNALGQSITINGEDVVEDETAFIIDGILTINLKANKNGLYVITIPQGAIIINNEFINNEEELIYIIDMTSRISTIAPDDNGFYHVYSPQGLHVITITDFNQLNALGKGFYIINGKKVLLGK